jgi:hypothetical protein
LYVSFGPEWRVYENQTMSREDPTHHHEAAPYQAGVAATTPLEQHPTWTPNEANDDAPKQVRFQSHSYTFPNKEPPPPPQQQQQQQREEKRGSMFMWVIFLIGVVLILLVAAYRFYTFRPQPEESQTDDYYDTHGTESPQTDTESPSIKDSTTYVSQDELYRWMLHVNERLQTMDQKLNQLDKSSSETQYRNSDTQNVSYDDGNENENDDEDDNNNNDDQSGPYHGSVEEFARFFAQVDPSGGSEFYSYAKPPPEDLEYVQNEYESQDKEAQEEDDDNDNNNDDEEKGQDNQQGETAVSTADSTVNNTGEKNIDAMATTTEPPQTGSEDQSEDFVPPMNSSMQGGNENYL